MWVITRGVHDEEGISIECGRQGRRYTLIVGAMDKAFILKGLGPKGNKKLSNTEDSSLTSQYIHLAELNTCLVMRKVGTTGS